MTSAVSVPESTALNQRTGAGSTPSTALHAIMVKPIPFIAAKRILVKHHYLHSMPGGSKLNFGAFLDNHLLGTISFGSGPHGAYKLVSSASPDDCLILTRLWLSDELPSNSESRVIGICLRYLRKLTHLKFIISYADPAQHHVGTIYQATGWLYTGLSETMPLFDLGDGKVRHSRSFSHSYGSHSIRYFASHGIDIKVVPQTAKYRYVVFLDKSYRDRLKVPVLPYPKKEITE